VNSAREEVGAKASNMNASRTRFVIVEAMLTHPSPAFCLLLGFLGEPEVIMVFIR
jgi:hypothetical protein